MNDSKFFFLATCEGENTCTYNNCGDYAEKQFLHVSKISMFILWFQGLVCVSICCLLQDLKIGCRSLKSIGITRICSGSMER